MDTLSLDSARRMFLAAQGFNDPRPTGRIDLRHLRRAIEQIQVGGRDDQTISCRVSIGAATATAGETDLDPVAAIQSFYPMVEALARARAGKKVALVSSGDAGVYGMAGPTYEVLFEAGWTPDSGIEVEGTKGEWGLGQHELNVRHAEVREMADRHVLLKQCAKETAEQAGEAGNVSASFLYAITALHILHLFGGVLALIIVLSRSIRKRYTPAEHSGVSMCATYWHFLGGLWVYLFFFLFFVR